MSFAGNAIDLRKAPISRVLIPFLLGMMVWDLSWVTIQKEVVLSMTLGCWAGLFLIFRFTSMGRPGNHLIFTLLSVILFLGAGYSLRILTQPEDPALPAGQTVMIRGKVLQAPVPTQTGWQFDLDMEMLWYEDSSVARRTKLKTYFRRMPHPLPGPGEQWQLSGILFPIKNAGNPGEVDYETIMAGKGYWYRFFVDEDSRVNRKLDVQAPRWFDVIRMREQIAGHWDGKNESAGLLRAVCLGDRSVLTDDQKQSYRDAGGMHLLAVSGLHIGLIWWVLHRLMAIMVRLFHRELYRTVPIILMLWCYAFLTGFSSSVCRAVTMFTLFSLALLIDQRTQPLNCLLVSLFLITAIDPGRIKEAGFQLSYAALFGIATFFPWLRSLPGKRIPSRFIRWVWEVTALSFAAQLSTAPLVIFYFHQIPLYALLTNMIAVPILSLLIALFVLSLPFLALDVIIHLISRGMQLIAMLLNRTMEVIAGFPGAVLRNLDLDRVTLSILLMMLILGAVGMSRRARWPRFGLVLSVVSLLGWGSVSALKHRGQHSLVITHLNGGTQVVIHQGRWVDSYCFPKDTLSEERMIHYLSTAWQNDGHSILSMEICPSTASRGRISACHPEGMGSWLVGNDVVRGRIISGNSCPQLLELIIQDPVTFIVLHDDPTLPSRALVALSGQVDLIADGSNSPWYAEQMLADIPRLHATSQLGAYCRTW